MLACNIEYVTEESKNPYCTCKWIKHRSLWKGEGH